MTADNVALLLPHGVCLAWDWRLLGLNAIGNLLIFLSYGVLAILVIHAWFTGRLSSMMTQESAPMWAALIWCSGFTHLTTIFTAYYPVYWFETLSLWTGALVAAVTAGMTLFRAWQDGRDRNP